MTKLYTKTGDDGTTSLANGTRVSKTDIRIETNGTIDELNAILGLAKAQAPKPLSIKIADIQHNLVDIMAAVAGKTIDTTHIEFDTQLFEQEMSASDSPFSFATPGSSVLNAVLHMARTKTRTCERRLWEVNTITPLPSAILIYLNRLSDYLFFVSTKE